MIGTGDARPRVRVNQVGYLPGRPMRATLVVAGHADAPVGFVVRDASGEKVHSGRSQPWPARPEPTSGQWVHVLDFTGLDATGEGFRVEADGAVSHPFAIDDRLYDPLAFDALRFFRLMRCGAPVDDPVHGRPAGHLGDRAVPAWTGPDAERLYPGWTPTGTFDVSGGWYDAGDYGKYTTSGALAEWQLLGTIGLLSGSHDDLSDRIRSECRWQLDWLLRMRVPAGDPLAGMAFHRVHGTEWSPLPGRPHEDPTTRVLHRPSTTATLHVAAAAAHGARLLRDDDPAYAATLLAAARDAYAAAHRNPVLLAPDDEGAFGGGPYNDADPADDFYWAAAELWLATGSPAYLRDLESSPEHTADAFSANGFDAGGFDFHRVTAPARLSLAGSLPSARESVVAAADRLVGVQERQPWGQPYAPDDGWDWGSNGRLLNNLVVLAVAHRTTGDPRYHDAVASGVDYLFGRNALGQSYVTGYGTDFSRRQRTRVFGSTPPRGALAGGANSKPTPGFPSDPRLDGLPPQLRYLDEPTSEVTNDVCVRWNAPLVFVAAYLAQR
ncbi:glycoside hydrolase family 9 protein [Virgisporangium ochraceum]|uniref:Endoglucanase n=1 Tax=Virgisporangium ochraceum TaxID=65505 RepID=A0A8J3ZQ68_9ACTN|nr:glycoside hydrolase family 9 protein [Virgisporangium ochraceum]GIJ68389.1 endoglucanase [Virgisporangium ochraceum]